MIAALAAVLNLAIGTIVTDPPNVQPVEIVEEFDSPAALYTAGTNAPTLFSQHQRAIHVEFKSVGNGTAGPTPINAPNSYISVKSPPGMLIGSTSPTEENYIQMYIDGGNKYLIRKLTDTGVWFSVPSPPESGYAFDTNVAFLFHIQGNNPVDTLKFYSGQINRVNNYDAAIDSRKAFGWPNTDGTWSEIQANAPNRPVNFGAFTYRGGLFAGNISSPDRSGTGRTQFFPSSDIPATVASNKDFRCAGLTAYYVGLAPEAKNNTGGAEPNPLAVDVHAATAESTTLSNLTYLQKESTVTWQCRWKLPAESAVSGEVLGTASELTDSKTLNLTNTGQLYCWRLSKIQSSGNAWDLFRPNIGAVLASSTQVAWCYFGSREWLTQKSDIGQSIQDSRSRFINYYDYQSSSGWPAFPANFP